MKKKTRLAGSGGLEWATPRFVAPSSPCDAFHHWCLCMTRSLVKGCGSLTGLLPMLPPLHFTGLGMRDIKNSGRHRRMQDHEPIFYKPAGFINRRWPLGLRFEHSSRPTAPTHGRLGQCFADDAPSRRHRGAACTAPEPGSGHVLWRIVGGRRV